MFLCEKCHANRDCDLHTSFYSTNMLVSYGSCEDCGKKTACVDCHAPVKHPMTTPSQRSPDEAKTAPPGGGNMMKIPVKVVQTIEANAVHVFLTVRDEFSADLVTYDEQGRQVTKCHAEYEGYVPGWMPGDTNAGDCVDLVIDLETGRILNWDHRRVQQQDIAKTFFPDKGNE